MCNVPEATTLAIGRCLEIGMGWYCMQERVFHVSSELKWGTGFGDGYFVRIQFVG